MSGDARKGQDLVDLFNRLGSPGSEELNGDDLDWIWDELSNDVSADNVERANFLRWITSEKLGALTMAKNVLSEEEVAQWNELQKNRPDLILAGERLEEAVQVGSHIQDVRFGHFILLFPLSGRSSPMNIFRTSERTRI